MRRRQSADEMREGLRPVELRGSARKPVLHVLFIHLNFPGGKMLDVQPTLETQMLKYSLKKIFFFLFWPCRAARGILVP